MKKTILMLAIAAITFSAFAQVNQPSREQMMRDFRQTIQKRHLDEAPLKGIVPMKETPAVKGAAKYRGGMPGTDFWFPGEWEEVKAVVVTCSYYHLVPGHEESYYWYADPLVTGYADYMKYEKDEWVVKGGGPYISYIDTVSAHGKVFFHLMDAIQSGNAEAWVRLESASDSAVVIRQLERMGLRHDRMRFLIGPGNSFWFRDCGPICFYYGDEDSVAM